MVAIWIGGALLLGLAVSRIGLPPLVGFLASGFLFAALGMERAPLLGDLAHAGVLLLLFAVGLKLRIKTLLRYEVWGTAISHLLLTGIIGVAAATAGGWLAPGLALALAVSFGFSSTVLAAKVLDGNRELRAVHGRVAIGMLIVQDVVAVVLLAFVNLETPSPYALLLLLVPFARPAIAWLLQRCGHGELLVLFGAALAIGSGEGFEALGLSAELGALLLGTMLADHKRSQELTNVLWSLKELFLVAFFLDIGFSGPPTWEALTGALWLVALLPLKGAIFFLLLIGLGLRARTSFLTAVSLTTYSEFALIVINVAVSNGLLGDAVGRRDGARRRVVVHRCCAVQRLRARDLPLGEPLARASRARQAASRRRADLARPRRDPHRRHGARRRGRVRLFARAEREHRRHRQRSGQDRIERPRGAARGVCRRRGSELLALAEHRSAARDHAGRARSPGQDIGSPRVAAARLSRAVERDPPVSGGARADSSRPAAT